MKRMVNRAGYDASDVQWWAKRTLGTTFDYLQMKNIEETCATTSEVEGLSLPSSRS